MNPGVTVGKGLIVIGIFLIAVGVWLLLAGKIPGLGRLPGDLLIEKKNFSFYFPLTTSIILSIILTLLFFFITRR